MCCGSTKKDTKESVKEYYGKILANKDDLKTSACCSSGAMPIHHREILKNIENDQQINKTYWVFRKQKRRR